MSIKAILDSKPVKILSIEGKESVLAAASKMAEIGVGSIVIMNGEELAGIFTERDLLKLCAKDHKNLDKVLIKDVMTKNLIVANVNDSLDDILNTMTSKKFRHVPIVDGNKLIGIISIGDAVKFQMNKAMEEAKLLREYIQS